MIKFLCWLNSVVLIHFNISSINWYGISHEEFTTILKEKDKYEMMKENLRNKNGESYEIMRFNGVKSKKLKLLNI